MLRKDPTTIRLTAEDIRDVTLFDQAIIDAAQNTDTHEGDHDQNWDSSIDESYLGSRGRSREVSETATSIIAQQHVDGQTGSSKKNSTVLANLSLDLSNK